MKAAPHIHEPWCYGDVIATSRRNVRQEKEIARLQAENAELRAALGERLVTALAYRQIEADDDPSERAT